MGGHNGLTEGQPQSKASAAVDHFIGPTIKHIENTGFLLIGNPRPIIRNRNDNPFVLLFSVYFDYRTGRGIFDGVVVVPENKDCLVASFVGFDTDFVGIDERVGDTVRNVPAREPDD